MSGVHEIDIEIHPLGYKSRISVDGNDLPVDRAVITMDTREMTQVELHAFKTDGEPYTIKGILLELDGEDTAAVREFIQQRQLDRARRRVGLAKA